MIYRLEIPMTPERQARIERLQETVIGLEKRASDNPGNARLQIELSASRRNLENLKAAKYAAHRSGSLVGDKDHPDYKVTEIDLGIIQPE